MCTSPKVSFVALGLVSVQLPAAMCFLLGAEARSPLFWASLAAWLLGGAVYGTAVWPNWPLSGCAVPLGLLGRRAALLTEEEPRRQKVVGGRQSGSKSPIPKKKAAYNTSRAFGHAGPVVSALQELSPHPLQGTMLGLGILVMNLFGAGLGNLVFGVLADGLTAAGAAHPLTSTMVGMVLVSTCMQAVCFLAAGWRFDRDVKQVRALIQEAAVRTDARTDAATFIAEWEERASGVGK